MSKQLQGSCSEWQVYAPGSPSPYTLARDDTVMAEGVSHSVIAKNDQTISQENSLLILLKLSFIPCCAYKNLDILLYKLLPEQNRTQIQIFSLSPGSDILRMYM